MIGEKTGNYIRSIVATMIVAHQMGEDLGPRGWTVDDDEGGTLAMVSTPDAGRVALQPAMVIATVGGRHRIQTLDGAQVIEAPTTEEGWDELEAAITATLTAAAESRWDR